jgi:C1A family cysteine protease/uncharacterized protein YjdB
MISGGRGMMKQYEIRKKISILLTAAMLACMLPEGFYMNANASAGSVLQASGTASNASGKNDEDFDGLPDQKITNGTEKNGSENATPANATPADTDYGYISLTWDAERKHFKLTDQKLPDGCFIYYAFYNYKTDFNLFSNIRDSLTRYENAVSVEGQPDKFRVYACIYDKNNMNSDTSSDGFQLSTFTCWDYPDTMPKVTFNWLNDYTVRLDASYTDEKVNYAFGDFRAAYTTEELNKKAVSCSNGYVLDLSGKSGVVPFSIYAWPGSLSDNQDNIARDDNSVCFPGIVSDTPSGRVAKGKAITLSGNKDGTEIHYTDDLTMPDRTSKKYTGPIIITKDTTLRAAAYPVDETETPERGWMSIVNTFRYDAGDITDDKYEPNNEPGMATDIAFPGIYSAMISSAEDKDYYRFTTGSEMKLNLNLTLPADVRYGLSLLDGNGNEIETSTMSNSQGIVTGSLPSGTYYALVKSLDLTSSDNSEYTLRLYRKYDDVKDAPDFSEANMAAAYHAKEGSAQSPYSGSFENSSLSGDEGMAINYLSSWDGPVDEGLDPYWGTPSNAADTVTKPYRSLGKQSEYHLQTAIVGPDAQYLGRVNMTKEEHAEHVKNMVYTYGAVEIAMGYYWPCIDRTYTNYYNDGGDYRYAPDGTSAGGGHAITLVGWDDDYPAEKFSTDRCFLDGYGFPQTTYIKKPTEDGAWICKNSWGKNIGENGFFYVSYESAGMLNSNPVAYIMEEGTDNYNRQYKNDPSGASDKSYILNGTAELANTFTTDGEGQLLKAVSENSRNGDFHYVFYVTVNGVKTKIAEGSEKYAGYYTHRLERPVYLPAGTDFTITEILYSNSGHVWIPVSYAEEHAKGRAFINTENAGKLTDTSSYGIYPCIRAFTCIPGEKDYKVVSLTDHTDRNKVDINRWLRGNSGISAAEQNNSQESEENDGIMPLQIDYSTSSINTAGLPEKFDLREIDAVSSAKDQGNYSCCWAFSACASAESNILLNHGQRFSFNRSMTLSSDQPEDIILTSPEPEKIVNMTADIIENAGEGNDVYWYVSGDTDSIKLLNDHSTSGEDTPVFTFVKPGKVTVTASAGVDVNATASKDFTATEEGIDSITLDVDSLYLKAGESRQLKASVLPEDAVRKSLVWSSSNTDVAFVDNNGTVIGVRNGTAVITVKGGTAEDSCTVTVGPSVSDGSDNGNDGSVNTLNGTNYTDPVKGHMNTLTGILTGSGNGCSRWISITDPQTGTVTWRLQYVNGTNAAGTWEKVNGKWYKFNASGTMQTGWALDNGKWYYLDPVNGDMKTGYLQAPDGHWYYFLPDGSMAVGDVVIDGVMHHFNDQYPPGPTYDRDPITGEWKPNGSNAIPYGAETE